MTSFKVGDKVGFSAPYWRGQEGTIAGSPVGGVYSVSVPSVGAVSFSSYELHLIPPAAREEKDVWEWLVEQSYLSEHDGVQAKAEYERAMAGVDALPTEVGWYESGEFLLRDGYNPYRLEWGIWYQVTEEGLEEVSHESMKELMPLTQLGAEADEYEQYDGEQAEGADA